MTKNNKGFVVTEVLIISTVVIGILIFTYAQFKTINRNYQYSFKYDTVQSMYLTNNIVNYINDGNYDLLVESLNSSGLGYLDISGCSVFHFSTSNYCQMLFEKSEVEQALFVEENLIDLKSGMFDLSEDMKEYINNISTINSDNDYRVIIKYKDGTFASMRFNKGETYVKNGLLVHLDGINNTGGGHSNEATIWEDLSGNGNEATLYNNPIWGSDSLTFNGLTNYARIENTASKEFLDGFTWEMRVQIKSIIGANENGNINIFGNYETGGGKLYYSSTNSIIGDFYDGTTDIVIDNQISNNIGKFYTVTVTYDNTNLNLYVNGQLMSTTQIEGPITLSSAPISLGGEPKITNTSMDSYGNVEFQNILIYNRALTEYEVLKNYQIDESRF